MDLKTIDHLIMGLGWVITLLIVGVLLLTDRAVPRELWYTLAGFAFAFGAFKGVNGVLIKFNGRKD